MSAKASAWAWSIIDGLKSAEKLVLLRLADHANDQGVCWPGKDSLAVMCCMSKRTVDFAIETLAARHLISVVKRTTETGKNRSNVYELHLDQGDLFRGVETTGVQNLQDCKNDELGVQILQGEGVDSAPESTNRTYKEPLELSSSGDEVQKNSPNYESKKGKKLNGGQVTRFMQFWEAFSYKAGKAEAADVWIELVEPLLLNRGVGLEHILHAARAEALKRPEIQKAGQTPKMAQGWLSARRWEDYEPARGSKPPEAVPWYHRWSGIIEEAGNRGIMHFDHPDPADLSLKLIEHMQAKGEEVPQGLRDYRQQLLRGTARQSA